MRRTVFRSAVSTAPERAAGATMYALNVGEDYTFSLLDKKGTFHDQARLLRLINYK